MSPSDEVNAATGEAPSAQEQLDVKRVELQQATAALEQAELAYDIPRTVQLQHEVEVLRRFVETLTTKAAVEAAAEAQDEAGQLQQRLAKRYTKALAALAPHLERARQANVAAAYAASQCTNDWAQAALAVYEIRVTEMRFGLTPEPLAPLPDAPATALRQAFEETIGDQERRCIKQPLPVYSSSASDSPEQVVVNKMVAAHRDVTALGKDLRLSSEVRALFAKAGAPQRGAISSADSAHIGTSDPLPMPPGALQNAYIGVSANPPSVPETAAEQAERERVKRDNTQRQAAAFRELGEAARSQAVEDELVRPGQRQGPHEGMRG